MIKREARLSDTFLVIRSGLEYQKLLDFERFFWSPDWSPEGLEGMISWDSKSRWIYGLFQGEQFAQRRDEPTELIPTVDFAGNSRPAMTVPPSGTTLTRGKPTAL